MDLLQSLWIAWQPIVDLTQYTIIGQEALIRGPVESPWAQPAGLFAWAQAAGQEEALESVCRQQAYDTAHRVWLSRAQRLFLNVDGRWPTLPDPWEHPEADEVPLAIEVSEQRSALENPAFLAALVRWRELGHLIVIDDYGTGYSAAATVLALQPDMIKLDRLLIAGIDSSVQKQATVRAMLAWTDDLGIQVIAEGIETEAELAALRALGCDYGQGYLLGRPAAALSTGGGALQARATAPAPPNLSGSDTTLTFYAHSITESPIPSYVVDRRRKVIAWNAAAEALLGHGMDELVGTRCFASPLDHQDRDGHRLCTSVCPLVHSMATGRPHQAVTSARCGDGRRQVLQVWVTPLFDASSGRVVGALEQFQPLAQWPSPTTGIRHDPEPVASRMRPTPASDPTRSLLPAR